MKRRRIACDRAVSAVATCVMDATPRDNTNRVTGCLGRRSTCPEGLTEGQSELY